jgi:small subunit ribosomal protein S3Ae
MATKKSKAKEWYSIIAPKLFEDRELGRAMVTEPEQLVGRKINVSLLELMNNFNKFYMKFIFRVAKVDGTNAYAEFAGSEVMRDYVSRMVLKRIRRIDTVQDLETKDKRKIRVKGLAIVSKKVKSSIEKIIRSQIKQDLEKEISTMDFDDFIIALTTDELKNFVLDDARKIYPVRNFEIRKTEVP